MPQNGQQQEESVGWKELIELVVFASDAKSDLQRMKRLLKLGRLEVSEELVDNVASMQVELAEKIVDLGKSLGLWMQDVEDAVFTEDDEDSEIESQLLPDDATKIRTALELAQSEVSSEGARNALQEALLLIADITLAEEDIETDPEAAADETDSEDEAQEETETGSASDE